ncbi:hypothetical protein ACP70R_042701 [Stipagrostis hirtigluma subsp. patula]
MDVKQTVRMNPGEGDTSYARNSTFQSAEQIRLKPLLEEAIMELCCTITPVPSSMVIADLGCSCGPSALTLVSTAIDAVLRGYLHLQLPPPELSLLLNDLPSNDFNAVVKHSTAFQDKHNGDKDQQGRLSPLVLTSIVPGSFYGRLFMAGSVHLVCSSSSLHWLSKIPEDLVKNGIPMYHGDENRRREMRPVVLGAYAQQFRKDFTLFLECRAQEMVPGGRMVFSLTATRSPDPANESTQTWELVARVLDDMASRGIIDKEKLKTFYIPLYATYEKEVKEIIEEQGSFNITKLEVHDSMSGVNKALINPKMIAYGLRAAFEPIIVEHFGAHPEIIDEFVTTVEQNMSRYNPRDDHDKNPRVFLAFSLEKRQR